MNYILLQELPVALTAIPGVKCTPELLAQPVIKGKVMNNSVYFTQNFTRLWNVKVTDLFR